MEQAGEGSSGRSGRHLGRSNWSAPAHAEHAGAREQRQARRAVVAAMVVLCAVLAAPAGSAYGDEPADAGPSSAWQDRATAAAAAMLEARERRLRDEQRAVEGRLRAIDRKLDVREFLHSRATTPVPPDGVPGPLQDPVAERLQIERRGLRDRDRLLEQRLRNEHFDRERVRRLRSW